MAHRPARSPRKAKYPLVIVRWHDAKSCGGWSDPTTYGRHTPAPCVTAGFLLKRDKKAVRIIQSYDEDDGQVTDSINIPSKWIRSLRYVRVR